MGLSEYAIRTETVPVTMDGGVTLDLVFRGLPLRSILTLMGSQGEAMQKIYADAASGKLDDSALPVLVAYVTREAPSLIGRIIAEANGEPDQWEIAEALPASDQIVCLDAIARLTFSAHGGPKKTLEIIINAAHAAGIPPSGPPA